MVESSGSMDETLRNLISEVDWDFVIICDAMRADFFEGLYKDYLPSGDYQRVNNGDNPHTALAIPFVFHDFYDAVYFNGGAPLWAFDANPHDYDERKHFEEVPAPGEYNWSEDHPRTCRPKEMNRVVREYLPMDKAVIKYTQPHFPSRIHPTISGAGQAQRLGQEELREAYIDNCHWVLDHVSNLLPDLDGTIVITSDHGECLGDCGQWIHGTGFDPHDHLVNIPFLKFDI